MFWTVERAIIRESNVEIILYCERRRTWIILAAIHSRLRMISGCVSTLFLGEWRKPALHQPFPLRGETKDRGELACEANAALLEGPDVPTATLVVAEIRNLRELTNDRLELPREAHTCSSKSRSHAGYGGGCVELNGDQLKLRSLPLWHAVRDITVCHAGKPRSWKERISTRIR